MRPRRPTPLTAALVALCLLAVACGGAKPKAATTPSPTPSPSPSPAAGPASGGGGGHSPSPALSPAPSPAASPAPGGDFGGLAVPALAWHTCTAPFQCSSIQVPLDWSQPTTAPRVTLSLIRLPASGARSERIGSLFVNPGGPGASAVDFARSIQFVLPDSVLRRFDIVAFDPRGMGHSQPISCLSGPQMDAFLATNPAPSTQADIDAVVAADKQFDAGCLSAAGSAFLAHVDTLDAARDMDFIRAALGDAKLTYLGYSYGTFLGAQYANLFPTHVRALVLDGAVDPAVGALAFDAQQAQGFDNELGQFFASCGPGCAFANGSSVKAAFLALQAKITAAPLKVGNRTLDQALFLDGVADAMYQPSTWPTLASALSAASNGDGSKLLGLADDITDRSSNGTYDALTSAGPAVDCVDSTYPTDVATFQADAQAAAAQAPIFGPAIVWSSLVCAFWPVPPVITPAPVHAAGAPPILVVGTTGDPATPYPMAVALATELSSGVLLRHVGLGHTSLGQGSDCVTNAEANYLISLSAPPSGSTCGSGGSPTPPATSGVGVAYRP